MDKSTRIPERLAVAIEIRHSTLALAILEPPQADPSTEEEQPEHESDCIVIISLGD